MVSLRLGRCEENCETSTDRLRVTERASLANLLNPEERIKFIISIISYLQIWIKHEM